MSVWVYRQNNHPEIDPNELRESDERMAVACAEDDDFDIYFFVNEAEEASLLEHDTD